LLELHHYEILKAQIDISESTDEYLYKWSSTWAKSPPKERFYALWGRFLQVETKILNWFRKNTICYFVIKAFDALSTPWFITKVIKHISNRSHNNQTNIVLCNASLYQLSKTTEIVTGWESSTAVFPNVMNVQVFCW